MRCMSAKEPSRSVDVVRAELSSQLACFLPQFLLYLLLTFGNEVQNNKRLFIISNFYHRLFIFFKDTIKSF